MSNGANTELHDYLKGRSAIGELIAWRMKALLYHHFDGHPTWMGPDLERKLKAAKREIDTLGSHHLWNNQTVGALIVKLSATESSLLIDVTTFQPCLDLCTDIVYLWRCIWGRSTVSIKSSASGSSGIERKT